jgi:hypothetical protein
VLALPAKRDGVPTPPQTNVTATDVLNAALNLEQLKSAFYQGGLANFTTANFTTAGYPLGVRGFYQQVLQHSQTYVSNITSLLGNQTTQMCTYNFPVQNVTEFVALSDTLEAISTSAYIGSEAYIEDKTLRVLAASLLATTSAQSSWVNSAVRGGNPWSTAYETRLDAIQTFTLLSTYITQCNNTNNTVVANPQLTTNPADAQPGLNVTISYPGQPANGSGLFAAFLNGIPITFLPLDNNFTVTVPSNLRGFTYLVVANASDTLLVNDSLTVAGPAFFNFPFNANNTLITLNL